MFSVTRSGAALASLLLSIAPLAEAQSVAEQHVELRATIEQWMQAVDKSQELENRWALEKSVLEDSIVGLKGMLEQSDADIATVKARLATADEASKEKLEQQEKFNEAREVLRKGLAPVESEVAKVVPLFPDFYVGGEDGSSKLKAAIESLEKHRQAEPDEKEKLSLNGRIQPLVQILTEAERFHGKLWAVTHPLKVGEVDKQMNVLYFGLSVAYAVDEGGSVALEGKSSEAGWTFTPMSGEEVAKDVLTLYKAADGSGESQMVSLPLSID
ncbi:DUF3450 family protein [Roseibacillus persicicus]|uniref:DUF3450 family protein n=1 Tax=Roseibacillus persicicus TaxID=454148 RepID=UPI00398ACE2B